jgi:PadR family transcriptional regulator PadR
MRKGVLEFCILSVLKEKDAYIGNIRHFEKRKIISGGGEPFTANQTKNDGLLSYRWEESTSGPPRKYYGLTEIGQTF